MELVDESAELSAEEKVLFSQSIDDIIRDSPNSTLAATRFKRLMAKMSKHTVEGVRSILIDIITEGAKKALN